MILVTTCLHEDSILLIGDGELVYPVIMVDRFAGFLVSIQERPFRHLDHVHRRDRSGWLGLLLNRLGWGVRFRPSLAEAMNLLRQIGNQPIHVVVKIRAGSDGKAMPIR